MLPCNLARGEVVNVLRDQASRFLKFVESLVQILLFLERESARERLPRSLQVFLRTGASGSASGIGAERRSGGRSVCGPNHCGEQHTDSCGQPSHVNYYRMLACGCLAREILGRELRS